MTMIVKKKDGSLRFCIDYTVNSTRSSKLMHVFPLLRIDDLLDQLGESKFFFTLDLASGYWQVQAGSPGVCGEDSIRHSPSSL